jgi:hypothetical protein
MSSCLLETVLSAPLVNRAPARRIADADRDTPRQKREPAVKCPGLPDPLAADTGWRQDQIADCIERILVAAEPKRRGIERRREARYPFPYPIQLTPYGDDGLPDARRSFAVIGKHVAAHGVDFYSGQPLAERRVIASLDAGREGWISLVLELTWCRFSRHGWYDNGGRFLAVVPSPLAAPARA